MPTLPTYDANRNINATQAAPFRQEADQPFKNQQVILGAVEGITQAWSDAQDTMQYTRAKANYEIESAKIQAEADLDPDYKNSAIYADRLSKLRDNSLQGIKNSLVSSKLIAEFDYGNQLTAIKIDTGFKKKEIEHSRFVLDEGLDSLINKKISALPNESADIDAQIEDLLRINVESGVISETEAKKKIEQMEKASVQNAINNDPEEAERMIARGEFQHLSPDDRVNFLKIVEVKKAQNETKLRKFYTEKKKATEDELQDRFFEDNLTITDLEEASTLPESEGGADRLSLERYKTALYKKTKEKIVDYVGIKYPESLEYVTLLDKVLDKETDIIKARQLLIDAYADGKIDKEEAKILDTIKDTANSIEIKKSSGIERGWLQVSRILGLLKESRKSAYTSKNPVENQAKDLRDFIKSVYLESKPPDEVFKTIIERRQNENYPEYSGWEKDSTHETEIGTVKVLGKDADGMPIVEVLGGKSQ